MTKALASFPPEQRHAVILRRIKTKTNGAGYWAAHAAAEKLGILIPQPGPSKKREPREHRSSDDRDARRIKRRQPSGGHKPFKTALSR